MLAFEIDPIHLAALEQDLALLSLHGDDALVVLHEKADLGLVDHDLLVLLEVLRLSGRDLPHLAVTLHLDPAKVLDPLGDLREKVELARSQAAQMLRPLAPHQLHANRPHGDDHEDADHRTHPAPGRR